MRLNSELNPHPLLDALLAELAIRNEKLGEKLRDKRATPRANDAALSRLLNMQPALISRIRNGVLSVPDSLRVQAMREFGWSIKRMDELAPPAAQE